MSKRTMILIAVIAVMALIATACGSGEATESGDGGTTAAPDTTVEGTTEAPDTTEGTDTTAGSEPVGEPVTISIESWRIEDAMAWEETIIPTFEASYPNIHVEFIATAPGEYSGAVQAKLAGGTAGDIITIPPFDIALALFGAGFLAPLTDLPGLDNFESFALNGWSTDDGSEVVGVPMASVIHGFYYNKAIFDELGLSEPATEEELFALLDAVKQDGQYDPLAIGTLEMWDSTVAGFHNISPNYYKGEEGRLAVIDGSARLTDDEYVAVFETLERWQPYLPKNVSAIAYTDTQNLFTLGRAAMYPGGSWEITGFMENSDFEIGAFRPPASAGQGTCYIQDHVDIGMGLNAASENTEAARTFLEWATTGEFASLYGNAVPGFFSLVSEPVELDNALANEFASWRNECESTFRLPYQILSRGEPNLDAEMNIVNAEVLNGNLTPQEAVQRLQDGLDSWYTPGG